MLAHRQAHILAELRRHLLESIVIGGLGTMLCIYIWYEVPNWSSLFVDQQTLSGFWESDSGTYLSFEANSVIIVPLFKSYRITLTDGMILYPNQQQQPYQIRRPLSSFLTANWEPQLVISQPGPIPVGIYSYRPLGPRMRWCPSP